MAGSRLASRFDRTVSNVLRRAGYAGQENTLVVAVSGGPDSSALLHALHRIRAEHHLKLHIAHLNHDIRGVESDEDADFVAGLARLLDLPATVEKQDPLAYQQQHHISSFEEATREMRYSFLYRVAQEQQAGAVAVGHTADDQAETVLEHILRGSGLHGLRGMQEVSPWPWPPAAEGVVVFRPLLGLTKEDTINYCREIGRDYRQDSDNESSQFTRNRVRRQLLPLLAAEYNPRITGALNRLADIAGIGLDFLTQECERLWPEVVLEEGDGDNTIRFDREKLSRTHPALQRELLRKGYVRMAGDARRLEDSHLVSISAKLKQSRGPFRLGLPRSLWVHGTYDALVISGSAVLSVPLPELEDEHSIELPTESGLPVTTEAGGWRIRVELALLDSMQGLAEQTDFCAVLDLEPLWGGLRVRGRRPGDRFQPLGMSAEKKLQDFFTDAKVPREWRDHVPLLVGDRGIAWVVGYRIAEWAKVDNSTRGRRPVLRIEFCR